MREFARGAPVQVRNYDEFFEKLTRAESLPRRIQIRLRRELSRLAGSDGKVGAFESDALIARAESRLGRADCDVVLNNCEHFATWSKTGMSDSEKVYALWQAILDPRSYLRLRRADPLTAMFDPGTRPRQ